MRGGGAFLVSDGGTGGASTTYGADAVSGVVNYITKKDFHGAQLTAQAEVARARGTNEANRIMAQMQKDLRLPDEPRHIECFDNSNIQGTNPVAACVVCR